MCMHHRHHPVYVHLSADASGRLFNCRGIQVTGSLGRGRSAGFRKVDVRRRRGQASDGKCSALMHRLVYECFHGPIKGRDEVCHIDGDRSNNSLNNLQLLSQHEHRQKRPPKRRKLPPPPVRVPGTVPHPVLVRYAADRQGHIYSPTARILAGQQHLGYARHNFMRGSDSIVMLAHRFVYECFHGLIEDTKLEVDHIDSDKSNNSIDNLQLLSTAAHREKTRRTIVWKPPSHVPQLQAPSEEDFWACPRFARGLEVCTAGIFRRPGGRPIFQGHRAGPYRGLKIDGTLYRAHVVVALTFLGSRPSEQHTVDHIDRNPLNNSVSNLRWASREEQAANTSMAVAVRAINSTGKILGPWLTKSAAARATDTHGSNITKALSGSIQQTGGLRWELVTRAPHLSAGTF